MTETFGIGELAREFGVTPRTIRFYEDLGLLTPLRERQRRIYRARDRVRLKLILRGKRLGFRLADVQEIIDLYDAPPGEAGQLRLLRGKIAERQTELEAKRRDIEITLADLAGVDRQCQDRLEELELADAGPAPASRQGSQGGQV